MICAIVVNTQTDTQTDKERETKNFNRSATLTSWANIMAFAGHVLRGSSSDSALTLMEGKMDGKSARTTQGMWMSKKNKTGQLRED